MEKALFAVPAVLLAIGLYLLGSGYTATGETLSLVGLEMQPRFVMLFGGIAVFAGVVVTMEMLGKSKRTTPAAE